MKTYKTLPGVQRFETGGPNGQIVVEAGKPFTTEDSREIGILEECGRHAVTCSAPDADKTSASAVAKTKGGDQ